MTLLAFSVSLFFGCGSNPLISLDRGDYLPMFVGAKWFYTGAPPDSTFRDTTTVVGTATRGGNKYFILQHTNNPIPAGDQRQFLRAFGNKIYINYEGRDFLYIDFNQPEGKSWESYADFKGMILRKDFEITTPAGHFSHAVEVAFESRTLRDAPGPHLTFVPRVGIVQYGGYSVRPAKLAGYNIDYASEN